MLFLTCFGTNVAKDTRVIYESPFLFILQTGIGHAYQVKPCLNPLDQECPDMAPNKLSGEVSHLFINRGGSRNFIWGGGGRGRKRLCAGMHITSAEPNSFSAGVQDPLKGPGSSRVVLKLSRAIWAWFLKHFEYIVNPFFFWGGGGACTAPPPLDLPLHQSLAISLA